MDISTIKKKLAELGYYKSTLLDSRPDEYFDSCVRKFQSDYFDQDGKPLTVDSIAGAKTKWAIENALSLQPDKLWVAERDALLVQVKAFLRIKSQDWKISGKASGHNTKFEFFPGVISDGLYMLIKETRPPATYNRDYLRSFTASGVLVMVKGDNVSLVGMPFKIATHPGQRTTTASGTPDVNGDGQPDIAWLMPNTMYRFESKRKGSKRRFNPIDYVTPVNRDYQTKGWIDDAEREKVFSATATQYHDDGGTNVPISVRCLVSPIKDYNRVAGWIESAGVKQFTAIFRYY